MTFMFPKLYQNQNWIPTLILMVQWMTIEDLKTVMFDNLVGIRKHFLAQVFVIISYWVCHGAKIQQYG